jgi:hypothetical protein
MHICNSMIFLKLASYTFIYKTRDNLFIGCESALLQIKSTHDDHMERKDLQFPKQSLRWALDLVYFFPFENNTQKNYVVRRSYSAVRNTVSCSALLVNLHFVCFVQSAKGHTMDCMSFACVLVLKMFSKISHGQSGATMTKTSLRQSWWAHDETSCQHHPKLRTRVLCASSLYFLFPVKIRVILFLAAEPPTYSLYFSTSKHANTRMMWSRVPTVLFLAAGMATRIAWRVSPCSEIWKQDLWWVRVVLPETL